MIHKSECLFVFWIFKGTVPYLLQHHTHLPRTNTLNNITDTMCVCVFAWMRSCVSNLPPESSSEEQKLVVSNWLLCWVDELSPPPVVSAPFCSTDWRAGLLGCPPTESTNQTLRWCNKCSKWRLKLTKCSKGSWQIHQDGSTDLKSLV